MELPWRQLPHQDVHIMDPTDYAILIQASTVGFWFYKAMSRYMELYGMLG